jgi:prepilin-type N-terminal cleavage/methylation domain-containing protein
MKRNQSGFTLIEIAIVLVIIGLLLGGVLKGQELINSAKVKNLATDFKNIPVFVYGYQDKFKALPGDDKDVDAHLGATLCTPTCVATAGTHGNGVIEGNWNDKLAQDSEAFRFWQHVRLAGLAPGPTATGDSGYIPQNSAGSDIGIQAGTAPAAANAPVKDVNGNAIRGSYIICSAGILGKFAKQLDTTLDDGKTETGSMLVTPTYTTNPPASPAATATSAIIDSDTYVVCMGV